jgi:tetratricopeptide (TPR) repeat protein
VARVQLAVVLRNAGRLQEAAQVAQVAQAAAASTGGQAALAADDAAQLSRLQVMLDGDLGRHVQALAGLQTMLAALPREARAATLLHRLRAQSQLALGLLDEALLSTQAVLDNAQRHGDRWEAANGWQLHTRVLAAQGAGARAAQALQSWSAAVSTLGATPRSTQGLRLRRAQAELDLHAGRPGEALRMLRELTQGEDLQQPPSPLELARSWELRGVAARQLGSLDEAAASLQYAAALYTAALPADHLLRLRNGLELALVQALRNDGVESRAPLRLAVQQVLAGLPAASAWRPGIETLMNGPSGGLKPAS